VLDEIKLAHAKYRVEKAHECLMDAERNLSFNSIKISAVLHAGDTAD
jgi:hypothetical protein